MFGRGCECVAELIVGIILGIIIGVLYFLEFIPGILIALWIAFGFAAGSFLILAIVGALGEKRVSRCICRFGKCLLLGASITLILSIIALSIIADITVASAVLIGFIGFALSFTIINIIELLNCIIESNCRCREE